MKYWRTPLDQAQQKRIVGQVFIEKERCKGCEFCVEYCPRDVLEMSPEFNRKGYHPPYAKQQGLCVNCGLCELICPEFAIFCKPLEDQPDEISNKQDENNEG
jgi:2-oxoglutarate ferredoxin oxidoreductase subunit delta